MKFLDEFKKFAMRGNVIDLAVGVIIGAAFTTVVDSIVKDLLNPVIGLLVGGIDFSNLFVTIKPPGKEFLSLKAAQDAGAVTINYGLFVNSLVKFLIVALTVFALVRSINKLAAPTPKNPPPPTPEVVLLQEIRDLLKAKS
ncbi:MAG TPA: large conductance mechanosensitive channel protein MscL [Alphaproteobacteria bacterium]|nr:large conductance mechanosensitive channel protein MscL [Alphaproteobacteria bacterium]